MLNQLNVEINLNSATEEAENPFVQCRKHPAFIEELLYN